MLVDPRPSLHSADTSEREHVASEGTTCAHISLLSLRHFILWFPRVVFGEQQAPSAGETETRPVS